MGEASDDNYKNQVVMWKTREELNGWELMMLRTGRLMVQKIENGKTYYKI